MSRDHHRDPHLAFQHTSRVGDISEGKLQPVDQHKLSREKYHQREAVAQGEFQHRSELRIRELESRKRGWIRLVG